MLDPIRLYLLAGLVFHKLVWEVLKRRPGGPDERMFAPWPILLKLLKAAKVGFLLGLAAQTLLPDLLPIAKDPRALRLGGTVAFTAGLLVAVLARVQLGRSWSDIETALVKPDQTLVSNGIYRYVRHPIYSADLMLLLGFELALNSWIVLTLAALAPAVFYQARREERLLGDRLPGYEAYCKRTKRFIPFVV